jgi:SAM-dependent methyltransferase
MNPAEFANIARLESGFWWYRGMRQILLGLLDAMFTGDVPKRVLDAGCGTGYFAGFLQQQRNWPVFAVDLRREGLTHARDLNVLRLAQGDIAALPFSDATFDCVFSLDVIVHLPKGGEQTAMRELVRVLLPKGMLILRVAALDALRSRHSQFTCERQRFTRGRLTELSEAHGIRVLRCTYANMLLLPVAFVKFRIWEPLMRKRPASSVVPISRWLDRLLYLPLALESLCLRTGMNFPLGQSLILVGIKE